jgi:prepilin-type N-terminal cleavage/methylation domain-containing protein
VSEEKIEMTRRKGFTLVELLTVTAVFAILAGVLMPSLAASREKGRQTTCLSNLRQIGQALSMYRADWPDPVYFVPPTLQALYPQYVRDARILNCPDNRDPSLAFLFEGKRIPLSYAYQVDFAPTRESQEPSLKYVWSYAYPRLGENYPICFDGNHQAWSENLYLVLRLDGSAKAVKHHMEAGESSLDL